MPMVLSKLAFLSLRININLNMCAYCRCILFGTHSQTESAAVENVLASLAAAEEKSIIYAKVRIYKTKNTSASQALRRTYLCILAG